MYMFVVVGFVGVVGGVISCHVMPCHVMLCYVLLSYVTVRHVMLLLILENAF